MIKAGEVALASAASNEALNYYRGALELYLKKYGAIADPNKLSMLERNIALALSNELPRRKQRGILKGNEAPQGAGY